MEENLTNDFQLDLFKNPLKQYRPTVRWWWPGLAVTEEELIKEIEELDTHGFGGAEIQAFLIGTPGSGKPDWDEQAHRFAPNPYYFQMLEVVAKEAAHRGLIIDLTIGSSWPPGGTQVTKEDSLKTLMMGTRIVQGPQLITMSLPPLQLNTFYKDQKILKGITGDLLAGIYLEDFKPIMTVAIKNAIRKDERIHFVRPNATPLRFESRIDLTPNIDDQCVLTWDVPEGSWQIFTIYTGPSGMKPLSDSKSSPEATSLVFDMFDEEAIQHFLDGHLKAGENILKQYYGTTIRAVFTDSQEIGGEWFWTSKFFEEFEKRREYDIRRFLPVCFVPNRDNQFTYVFFMNTKPCYDFPKGIGERIRYDWELTLSDLFAEIYCAGVARYANQYGIKHKIQTYGIRADLLKAYGCADIPETEQLFAGGMLDFLKLAGSAGVIYEKPIVSAESLVWAQRDYLTTPLKWKVAADRLFIAGINHMNYHGFPYFTEWKAYPGHYPWSPPCFSSNLNRNNPFWEYFPLINQYVTRGQFLMQQGRTQSRIAMFYSQFNYDYKMLKSEDMVGGYLAGFDTKPAGGPIMWYQKRIGNNIDRFTLAFQLLGDTLMDNGYYYTHLNEEKLLNGIMENGVLRTGWAAFEVIIFPFIKKISLEVAKKLEELVQQGIKVIFYGDFPNGQPGFLKYEENDVEIQTILQRLTDHNLYYVNKKQNIAQFLRNKTQIQPDIQFSKVEPNIRFIHKLLNQSELFFIHSSYQKQYSTLITFPGKKQYVYSLNLWNGEINSSDQLPSNSMTLQFAPYESKMLLFTDDVYDATPQKEILRYNTSTQSPCRNPISLNNWHLSIQNRLSSGEMANIELMISKLQDWRNIKDLRYASGPAIYSTTCTLEKADLEQNSQWILNLGLVHDVAIIQVNDTEYSPLLVPEYVQDITDALIAGENKIEVKVIGTIRNLLVGYAKAGIKGYHHHRNRSLMPIGLIGPVNLEGYK